KHLASPAENFGILEDMPKPSDEPIIAPMAREKPRFAVAAAACRAARSAQYVGREARSPASAEVALDARREEARSVVDIPHELGAPAQAIQPSPPTAELGFGFDRSGLRKMKSVVKDRSGLAA